MVMDRQKFTRIMPTVVGIGFCVIAAVKLWAMSGASFAPDPASGRTEAAMFAPAVSTSWSYITHTQILVLA
jgi:type III secretory pathway component EscT